MGCCRFSRFGIFRGELKLKTKVSEKQAIIGPGLLRRRCCSCCSSASYSRVHVNGQRSGYLNEEIENTAFSLFFRFVKKIAFLFNPSFSTAGRNPWSLFAFCPPGGRADCPRFDQHRSEPCEGCPARQLPRADYIISVAATPQNGCCLEQFPLPGKAAGGAAVSSRRRRRQKCARTRGSGRRVCQPSLRVLLGFRSAAP